MKIIKFKHKEKCAICGKEFLAHRKCQKYCSAGCRIEAEKIRQHNWGVAHRVVNDKMEKKCPVCGKVFEAKRNSQKYCTVKCREVDRNIRKNETCKTAMSYGKYRAAVEVFGKTIEKQK